MIQKQDILDRKVLGYILLFVLVAFLLSTSSAIFAKLGGRYQSFSWEALIGNVAFRYISKLVYILLAVAGVRYARLKFGLPNYLVVSLHVILGAGLSFFSVASQTIFGNLFYGFDDPITWEYISQSAVLGTDYNFFLYVCILVLVYAYYYFKNEQKALAHQAQLREQLLDAKIRALNAQIQPHFLFNTLNDISALVDLDPENAQNAISDLSDLIRKTMNISNERLIPLKDELELLNRYVQIEAMRFQDKLLFDMQIEKDMGLILVPPLILQPIVENAIKHGFSVGFDKLEIKIGIQTEQDYIVYLIANNGAPIDTSGANKGTGLSNINNRLAALYDKDYRFQIENAHNSGVRVQVEFPITNKIVP